MARRSAADYRPDALRTVPMNDAIAAAHALFGEKAAPLLAKSPVLTWEDISVANLAIAEAAEVAEPSVTEPWLSAATLRQAMPSATIDGWARTHALLDAHLAASDLAALGSDVAGQSGVNGSFATLALSSPTSGIGDSGFGNPLQTLRPQTALQEGVKLG